MHTPKPLALPPWPQRESMGELARRNHQRPSHRQDWRAFCAQIRAMCAAGALTAIPIDRCGVRVPAFRRARP